MNNFNRAQASDIIADAEQNGGYTHAQLLDLLAECFKPLTVDDLVRYAETSGLNQQLRDALDERDAAAREPCTAEYHSWWYFNSRQVDSYWMRCTLLGPHKEHEDSHTGAHWKDECQ